MVLVNFESVCLEPMVSLPWEVPAVEADLAEPSTLPASTGSYLVHRLTHAKASPAFPYHEYITPPRTNQAKSKNISRNLYDTVIDWQSDTSNAPLQLHATGIWTSVSVSELDPNERRPSTSSHQHQQQQHQQQRTTASRICSHPNLLILPDLLKLPDLDGDDPTMGLDILSCSSSCSSVDMIDDLEDEYGPSTSMSLQSMSPDLSHALSALTTKPTLEKKISSKLFQGVPSNNKVFKKPTSKHSPTSFATISLTCQLEKDVASVIAHPTTSSESNLSQTHSTASAPGQNHSNSDVQQHNEVLSAIKMKRAASAPANLGSTCCKRNRVVKNKHTKEGPIMAKIVGGVHKHIVAAINTKRDKLARIICVNCNSSSTPQWRMGPTGPKTLCNACGVRFKKGLPLQMEGGE